MDTQALGTAYKNTKRGFTLIELLVSVFIFTIVMTISMGTLLVLIDASEKGQNVQVVMSNLSFALDSMTRHIRTGRNYFCSTSATRSDLSEKNETQDCGFDDPGRFISFTESRSGQQMGYRLGSESNGGVPGAIERRHGSVEWLPITTSELYIEDFRVVVDGSTQSDVYQPQASILIRGYVVSEGDTDTDFTLQTQVTQRTLDF